MSIRSLRIPEEMEQAIDYVARKEKIEKSQSLRKLARIGFEYYVASAYREGRLSLREGAELMGTSVPEALALFEEMGVRGNVRAADVLASLESLPVPASGSSRPPE